jgi:hypothetical protein
VNNKIDKTTHRGHKMGKRARISKYATMQELLCGDRGACRRWYTSEYICTVSFVFGICQNR